MSIRTVLSITCVKLYRAQYPGRSSHGQSSQMTTGWIHPFGRSPTVSKSWLGDLLVVSSFEVVSTHQAHTCQRSPSASVFCQRNAAPFVRSELVHMWISVHRSKKREKSAGKASIRILTGAQIARRRSDDCDDQSKALKVKNMLLLGSFHVFPIFHCFFPCLLKSLGPQNACSNPKPTVPNPSPPLVLLLK